MLQQILKYWYAQEYFSPCWPVNMYEDTNLAKSALPWLETQMNPKIKVSYDVYLGKARTKDLITWMLNALNLQSEEDVENDNSLVCLCALKIDEQGSYVENSFAISSFVWAICKLVTAGSIREKLRISDLEALQESINKSLLPNEEDLKTPCISNYDLLEIYSLVCNQINLNKDLFTASLWARKKTIYANKDGNFPPLDPATELMQSFYLKDMEKVHEEPNSKIQRYVLAMAELSQATERIQIDTDVSQMKKWLEAKVFPLGAWPSNNSPSLMQQLGINIAISGNQDIFSINGPPGTGKTTLLKEIVVSNIIQRAIVMASYDSPDEAFSGNKLINPPDQYNKVFYKIDNELTAFGMIVASNNNAAVENISVELPKAISKDRTERFAGVDVNIKDTYFSDIATKLLDEPAWGLISAKLGKKSNIKALKERLWWAEDGITLKRYYEEDPPDWNSVRQNFNAALKAVLHAQNDIAVAQDILLKQEQAEEKCRVALNEDQKVKDALLQQQDLLKTHKGTLNRLESNLVLKQQNMAMLKSQLVFFKRVFWKLFKSNSIIKEWKQIEKDADETVILITRHRATCHAQSAIVEDVERAVALTEHKLAVAKQELQIIQAEVKPYKEQFKNNWVDAAFWKNISTNKKAQVACPWTYVAYDKLREELFYQALMLNKAFVLSSNCVKQNLMRLFTMWDGKFAASDCKTAYGSLINTLLLVVPVISTTFASVQTFLDGVGQNELGILVIDESGQATPQSALGALWRTRKAIVVGDPLQVEPIVTIPKELKRLFAEANDIPPVYRLPELSVQMLADQLNPYGGIREIDGEKIWLGCPLVVHRRCLNPMFQISNEIAYNGRMFLETPAPDSNKKFLLQQSVWFDIKGKEKGNKDHSVQQQIDVLVSLLTEAIDIYAGLPDIYIITPFTSVEHALKQVIRPLIKKHLPHLDEQMISDWLKDNCGTIHTFQGKEANEVLLVMGCDVQSGKGAARWVGEKPNIINVAVSRAKYRLGVIGDLSLWTSIPNVQMLCRYLQVQ